ncbi:glycine cleavage system aminomethyltransferase GcvT [Alteraurantiacibacter aquimixticola]|uniref:aminomethyltransferase n=1 Tax=Alteraurantiacibacter aquimixticola TaxID=2489173 RepID=A0A4T3F2C7_9SPHN|nr:glycine cleavage system aminomethyltransferase GcvT [Alteraurantiacibacter aquimixticola]TIX50737.1 glycine cleavage system aminomethyltransferase GcvT [Alteraurantiacibacter aquimixticola]
MAEQPPAESPVKLPLDSWHIALGARMVPFAGYSMPIQYEGIMAEHEWTRSHAGLFDVSHMGQVTIAGEGAREALESLIPADLAALAPGRMRYSLLLAEDGGILDDLIVTALPTDGGEAFGLVVNGAMKGEDIAHLRACLPQAVAITYHRNLALLALQGPEAAAVLDDVLPGIDAQIGFMQSVRTEWQGAPLQVARSGYTGEDGFEISLPATMAEALADALVADERARPVGLGARDSLRLEAGLPLYGHDLTTRTDPVSAGLAFAISKRRRAEGGFPGHARIMRLLEEGPPALRVGLALEGRMPAREGSPVLNSDTIVGQVTSGGFAPSLGHPIAMAYVDAALAAPGTALEVEVRGRRLPARVTPMPFVPHNYHRAGAA